MKITLPEKSIRLINNYLNMRMGPYIFVCPYFQNRAGKSLRSVFLGKGSPQDIKTIASGLYHKYRPKNALEAKKLLKKHNIGIDCSGFALHVVLSLLPVPPYLAPFIIKPPNNRPLTLFRHYLRFFTNISADTLTSTNNCIAIDDINCIHPGDLIRTGKVHVGVITEVTKRGDKVISFKYSHSISGGSNKAGVSMGKVNILHYFSPLEKQEWIEKKSYMLNEYTQSPKRDRGIRRLKFFQTFSA